MQIRDWLAAHDANFISVSDLLAAIAEAEDATFQDVARAWSLEVQFKSLRTVLRANYNGALENCSGEAHRYQLTCAMHNVNAWLDDEARAELDLGEPGYIRKDVAAALSAAGWAVPECLTGRGSASDGRVSDGANHAHLRAELDRARARIAELEREREELLKRIEDGGEPAEWTRHRTKLFCLLPDWIESAQSGGVWEKQETLVKDMVEKYGLTNAEAKALDAVTRPDSLRKK